MSDISEKTLGLDLGTNSIGWAVVERNVETGDRKLLYYGSHIFQEGVAREKNLEKPAVQDRTDARALRRHYARRRLHKIELLKVLTAHEFCPALTDEELENWRRHKRYPVNPEFMEWQRTDDNTDKNPYHARHDALTRRLNLSQTADRYVLGRALYHLAQRRGFLSNRKDLSKESEGEVKKGIDALSAEIDEASMRFPGEYFYRLYQNGEKIRDRYQHRITHVENEFYAICERQGLAEDTVKALHRAIFYQRPLKSQKGTVGHCTFEPKRQRCQLSHPEYEEFRMLQFLNNVRIQWPGTESFRPLLDSEKKQVYPLFFRKSVICKASFDFEDIAKKIAGRGNYTFRDGDSNLVRFNIRMTQSVPACPVTAGLKSVFGEDPATSLRARYTHAGGKSDRDIVADIWHVLATFDSDEKLMEWGKSNLALDDDAAKAFAAIRVPQGYASLSLKAIRRIVPFMRQGLRYDEAAFLANIPAVLARWNDRDENERQRIIDEACAMITEHDSAKDGMTKQSALRQYLEDLPDVRFDRLGKLYHPSQIEQYPEATVNVNGELLLGSPRISAIRNPMAMRALFRLRDLVNTLLREKKIDRTTRINIEFSRMLNDANMRKAIERSQRDRESLHKKYAEEIRQLYRETTGRDIEPSATDILKYTLWTEQNHRCLYTGRQIGIADFLGDMPRYDIEHTIARSLGGDNSQANKTLCDLSYNRNTKRDILPANLSDSELILENVRQAGWMDRVTSLSEQVSRLRVSGYMTKEARDAIIQKRNYLKLQLDYWRGKVERFTMTEVPTGFTNRQGVDIGIIGKYAKLFLESLFKSENRQVFTVKGATTAEFRVMWGLQDEYTRKERVNHCHHTIDAIVIACIGRNEYHKWAEYNRALDRHEFEGTPRPRFDMPWPTFASDVRRISDGLLVAHHTDDRRLKESRRCLRKRGRIVRNAANEKMYQQGDTARARLHQETFYGAIKRDGAVRYVIRKPLSSLDEKDIDKIVDPAVRETVQKAVSERGFKNLCSEPVYMNREKGVEIKKVRIYAPSVTQPIHLKKHRDLSDKPYKRDYHVANDSNYCVGLYEGVNDRGKAVRSCQLINNLEAVRRKKSGQDILPLSDDNGLPLRHVLKPGQMVLFYENSPQEIFTASKKELVKRLYKLTIIAASREGNNFYCRMSLRHHQDAKPASEIKYKNGKWTNDEIIRPGIIIRNTQFQALVEGEDFRISSTGEIHFLHR